MIDRVEEWHHRNPSQTTKGQLSSNVNTTQLMYDCVVPMKIEEVPMVSTTRLNSDNHH